MQKLYELNNIEQYYDGKKVLDIKKLVLNSNQIIGFFGPNGSGKSTLFSLLSFIEKPTGGSFDFNGLDSKKVDTKMRRDVIMVPQNPYLLKRSVFENIAYGLRLRNESAGLEAKVHEALALVGLESSFAKRKWSQLSGGEAQRVALAARLILKPMVLILDEPTSGVDTNSAQLIKEAILMAKQKWNTTILISSHDHKWLNQICDSRVALFQGSLIEGGGINLLFAPWQKNSDKNLVKKFLDGQSLVIKNSASKKRDAAVMIEADAIELTRVQNDHQKTEEMLLGVVTSIGKQYAGDEDFYVEFSIGGVSFTSKISQEQMQKERFLPADRVHVSIDTSEVRWWTC